MEKDIWAIFSEMTIEDNTAELQNKDDNVPLPISNTEEDNSKKKKSKKTSKNGKSRKIQRDSIKDETEILKYSVVGPGLIASTNLKSFGTKRFSVDTPNSWEEMLAYLIGSLYNKSVKNFDSLITSKNILNEFIQISKTEPTLLDRELKTTSLYRVPFSPYWLVIKQNLSIEDMLYLSIRHMIEVLNISLKDIEVEVINKNAVVKEPEESKKIIQTETTYTLKELNTGEFPEFIYVSSCSFYDVAIPVTSLKQAVELLITQFTSSIGADIMSEILIEYTEDNIVGVTNDNQKYFGTYLKVEKIPNTELYFFSNGVNKSLVNYLYKLCEELEIDQSDIKFTFVMAV